jgi:hypothetical protein
MFECSRAVTSAAVCAFLIVSRPAFGSDATGVIHPTCDLPYGYQIELTNYGQHRLEKTIRFKALGEIGQWLDELGMDCGAADPCAAYFSRIQVLRVSRQRGQIQRMSGNVTIILNGGRKLEGSFVAKFVKPPRPLICE